jgi:hypothetical protein
LLQELTRKWAWQRIDAKNGRGKESADYKKWRKAAAASSPTSYHSILDAHLFILIICSQSRKKNSGGQELSTPETSN